MIRFSSSHQGFYFYFVNVAILFIYLGISYFIGFSGDEYKHEEQPVKDLTKTTIDVFLPCCGEPLELLQNTYKHVAKLKASNVTITVLDDKKDIAVAALADKFGFNYLSRPEPRVMRKSGNLRFAFHQTRGEFIVIFDADFCPREDFLKETIPHMLSDEKLGILQTPQFFEITDELNDLQKGASYIQELFYRMIQVNRNHYGASICVGTNAVYRRRALEPHGGTALIGYSEDVHTGFMLSNSGWKIKYIPVNLASGTCPDKVSSFFNQQYRWAMGSITLALNPEFWTSRLKLSQKLCYLSGMLYYIATGIGVILIPLPSLLLLILKPEMILWYNAMFYIPSFLFGLLVLKQWGTHKWGWYIFRARFISYWAHLFALIDKLRGNLMPWAPTNTTSLSSRYYVFLYLSFTWTYLVAVSSIMISVYRMHQFQFYNFIPTILFSLFYFFVISQIYDKELMKNY